MTSTNRPPLRNPVREGAALGYAWLQDQFGLPDFLSTPPARLANVAAIQTLPEGVMLVPARMAPAGNVLEHVLFALKHEGVNLYLLAHGLCQVPGAELAAAFADTPNGIYLRKAGYLWEHFNGAELPRAAGLAVTAAYVPMFEPSLYLVGHSRRNTRWRIDFNGLGDLSYCPVVRRTPALDALLREDILGQARAFAERTGKDMLDRAMSWAYLSETEGSFAIEGEIPTQSKATAFANLLKHAGDPRPISEDYLVQLQNAVITNPLEMAVEFRQEQNRLQGPGRGAIGVTYVPPEPELAHALMTPLMAMANQGAGNADTHALVHAALVSFGFVYIHPFMDGNGRLSRFLIHYCLGQSRQLPPGFVLPISVAMKRHEAAYLAALRSFSRPARDLCQVTWLDGQDYTYDWIPHAQWAFRYVDMTACVEFTLRMAQDALEHDLQRETQFLAHFDRVQKHIDERFDLRGSDLAQLIVMAFQNGGVLSKHRRKQFALRVQPEALDAIEAEVKRCLEESSTSF